MKNAILVALLAAITASESTADSLADKSKQILKSSCYRCHGENGSVEGGLTLILDRDRLVQRGYLTPGNPKETKLLRRMKSSDSPMPPEGEHPRPSEAEIDMVQSWIEQGCSDWDTKKEVRESIANEDIPVEPQV